jgi:hypothetical protein
MAAVHADALHPSVGNTRKEGARGGQVVRLFAAGLGLPFVETRRRDEAAPRPKRPRNAGFSARVSAALKVL